MDQDIDKLFKNLQSANDHLDAAIESLEAGANVCVKGDTCLMSSYFCAVYGCQKQNIEMQNKLKEAEERFMKNYREYLFNTPEPELKK